MTTTREQFKESATEATERLQTVLRDGAYATVGAGDTLFRSAKTFAGRLATLREEAPERAKHYKTKAEEVGTKAREYAESRRADVELSQLRSNVESEFDQLAARGREIVTTLQGSKATRRAAEQTKAATGQVKAAAEGVVSAAGSTAEEARSAVEGLRKTAEERAQREAEQARESVEDTVEEARETVGETVGEARESVEEAGASVKEAGEATVDALAAAREKLAEGAHLEDLSVPELRKLAQERDVPGRTGMNKAELIKALAEQ